MKKTKKKMLFSSVNRIFPILILVISVLMSTGYASINSVLLSIGGTVFAYEESGVFISNVTYYTDSSSSAVINHYSGKLLNTTTTLGKNTNASVTYEITVKNTTNDVYSLTGILGNEVGNDLFYDNYNINCYIKNIANVPLLLSNNEISFEVVFEYADGVNVDVSDFNNVLNSYISFDFQKIHNITYDGIVNYNYPAYCSGSTFNITFINDIPFDVYVEGASSYNYNKPNLVINGIEGDILIKGLEGFEYIPAISFDKESYLDTGISLFSDENIDKNFELSFTIDDIGSKPDQFATLVNGLYEGGMYQGFLFRVYNGQYELVANTDSVNPSLFFEFDDVYKVTIVRVNKLLYYKLNDNDSYIMIADYTNFYDTFDLTLTFGASIDAYGYPFRVFSGTLSNIYVKFLPDNFTIN